MATRQSGVVKWFDAKKGFGFIKPEEGNDIYVHYGDIEGGGRQCLNEGQYVTFLAISGDKGIQAEQVQIISS